MFHNWQPDPADDELLGVSIRKAIDTNTRVDWFDSPEEFAAELVKLPDSIHQSKHGAAKAVEAMRKGDTQRASEAEALIQQVENSGLLASGFSGMTLDVAGHVPCAPAAISGMPENMFRKHVRPDSSTLIRVVVDSGLSGGLDDASVVKKGVMLLAFVMGLAAHRPVEFWMVTSNGSFPYHKNELGMRAPAVRMPMAPMDLPTLAWFLCNPTFERSMTYHWTAQTEMCSWGWGIVATDERYNRAVRRGLQLDRHDIFFPGNAIPISDPVQWVSDQLAEHLIEYQNA